MDSQLAAGPILLNIFTNVITTHPQIKVYTTNYPDYWFQKPILGRMFMWT